MRPLRFHVLAGRLAGTVSRTLPFRRRIPDVQVLGLRPSRVFLRPLPLPSSTGLRLHAGYRPAEDCRYLEMKRAQHNLARSVSLSSLPRPNRICQERAFYSIYFNAPFELLLHDVNLDEAPARIGPGSPSRVAAPCAAARDGVSRAGVAHRLNRRRPEPKLESEGITL